jgi:hypothetical protein
VVKKLKNGLAGEKVLVTVMAADYFGSSNLRSHRQNDYEPSGMTKGPGGGPAFDCEG